MQRKLINSHTENVENKRKRVVANNTKNKKKDKKDFVSRVSEILMPSDTEFIVQSKKKKEENMDPLLEAIKEFLTYIKDYMVGDTIELLTTELTKEKWENHFSMNVIKKLREDSSDASKRVLKQILSNQSNRFESVKLLFQFVSYIMTLKEQPGFFNVSASEFMKILKANDTHINWLLNAINAVISCHNCEPNVDAEETLRNILNDYIDVWTFYISTPSEKKCSHYNSMMPSRSLDELRSTIMNVLYPIEARPEVIVIEESQFRRRKRRLKEKTVKIRNSLAFEVHRVKVSLHLTKHLMRNFVANRSSKERNHILQKVKSCPYEFYLKFESVNMTEILSKIDIKEIIRDQIIQHGEKKEEIRVKIDYQVNPELEEVNGNFWIATSIDLP